MDVEVCACKERARERRWLRGFSQPTINISSKHNTIHLLGLFNFGHLSVCENLECPTATPMNLAIDTGRECALYLRNKRWKLAMTNAFSSLCLSVKTNLFGGHKNRSIPR
jgi:hypothetical protein